MPGECGCEAIGKDGPLFGNGREGKAKGCFRYEYRS